MDNISINSIKFVMNEIVKLQNENKRINDQLNSQNSVIADLKSNHESICEENKRVNEQLNSQNFIMTYLKSSHDCITEELNNIKKEMYSNQERHMNSILDIVQELSQNNEKVKASYGKLKLIKEKHDRSVQKRNLNPNLQIAEKFREVLEKENIINAVNSNSDIYNDESGDNTFLSRENESQNKSNISKNNQKSIQEQIEEDVEVFSAIKIEENVEQIEEDDKTILLNSSNEEESINKPYYCRYCSRRFRHIGNLKTHIRVHTGERPFKCKYCSKSFTQSSSLGIHIRLHKGEKPFRCIHCPKGFRSSGNLETHLRVHTGERPFICTICPNKKYTRSDALKRHIKQHENGQLPYAAIINNNLPDKLDKKTNVNQRTKTTSTFISSMLLKPA